MPEVSAHAPDGVGEVYPGVDRRLVAQCRVLVLALITTWRFDRDDQLPDGRRLGAQWLRELRAALDRDRQDGSGGLGP